MPTVILPYRYDVTDYGEVAGHVLETREYNVSDIQAAAIIVLVEAFGANCLQHVTPELPLGSEFTIVKTETINYSDVNHHDPSDNADQYDAYMDSQENYLCQGDAD